MLKRKTYATDLTDYEWHSIEPLLPGSKPLGRKIEYSRREILNALFYLNRNGCTWRNLPHDFPPYGIVSHYYQQWRTQGLWQLINDTFRVKVRRAAGRKAEPTAGCIDSQSVKTARVAAERGYDAGKKINGCKRHILVDTLGLLMIVVVHSAAIQDRDGAKLVLAGLPTRFPSLKRIWADGGYRGQLIDWVKDKCHCVLEIIKRNDDVRGFKVLPRRWVVERTFGWLTNYRRLARDYECDDKSSAAMVQIAMIRLMLARLDRQEQAAQRRKKARKERKAMQVGFALAD